MINTRQVINGLLCISGDEVVCSKCRYANANGVGQLPNCQREVAKEAIALLKEQPKIVQCEHCVHWTRISITMNGNCHNNMINRMTREDDFCSQGKLR